MVLLTSCTTSVASTPDVVPTQAPAAPLESAEDVSMENTADQSFVGQFAGLVTFSRNSFADWQALDALRSEEWKVAAKSDNSLDIISSYGDVITLVTVKFSVSEAGVITAETVNPYFFIQLGRDQTVCLKRWIDKQSQIYDLLCISLTDSGFELVTN